MRFWAALCVSILLPAFASEAAQHYRPWTDPNAPSGAASQRQQDFVDKLKGLIDEAEKARAADPGFLRDLRGLAREYDSPRRRVVLSDRFEDGDFTDNPTWTVTQGRYWVERGWGLRSAVKVGSAAQSAPEPERRKGRDVAAAIFGQILQQALDPEGKLGSGQTAGTTGGAAGGAPAAAIQTAVAVTNAFAVEIDFSSWSAEGRLEIGPYQGDPKGAERAQGYVLAYTPGGGLELLRVSARGSSVLDRRTGLVALEDKKTHRLLWTRNADGLMAVFIDGREVLKATDQSIRGPFEGFRMVNRGGDYILKRIAVFSTN
ncbi:MAG: hypothetical protein IH994_09750 [Proteobacteria bacterium]|nr:hypothetical protein [Pseudomonadota bacterium]